MDTSICDIFCGYIISLSPFNSFKSTQEKCGAAHGHEIQTPEDVCQASCRGVSLADPRQRSFLQERHRHGRDDY